MAHYVLMSALSDTHLAGQEELCLFRLTYLDIEGEQRDVHQPVLTESLGMAPLGVCETGQGT